jgi:NADPH2:quinone reductase
MKAIRIHHFGGPEVMGLEEVADLQPGPDQVVVQVKAIGVNPVDTYIRSGTYAMKPGLPYTPGSDAAGIVKAIGKGITLVRTGDRVYIAGTLSGAYAQQALCQESQVHPLVQQVSFSQGAAIGTPYATAYRALFFRAQAKPSEVVLVHGASGGVGIAAVQLARAAGMRVIGTASTQKGRDLVIQQGAHYVLDHQEAGYLDEVPALTGGRGVDVILEMLANVNLGRDLKILALRGRVVVVGNRGTVEIDPRDTMGRDAAILGMALFNASEAERASIHAALVAGLENGTLHPVVGQELPLTNASQAHEIVMKPGAYGKIVLIP